MIKEWPPGKTYVTEIRLAWWFTYLYVPGVLFFCNLFKMDFNKENFNYWLQKAIVQKNRGLLCL